MYYSLVTKYVEEEELFKGISLWITGFGFLPSHPVPAGCGREPCMSTDLGSLTKALRNLFCHIPFTPRNGSRTAYQSSWVTARCPSRLESIERFSPLNVPPSQLQQDSISVWQYPSLSLPYAAMWPNDKEWITRCLFKRPVSRGWNS